MFDLCVRILIGLADVFGVSYNEINVWIFCIIWPVLTIILLGVVIWQSFMIRNLGRRLRQN